VGNGIQGDSEIVSKFKHEPWMKNEEDYIVCRICNKKLSKLEVHIKRTHKITVREYKDKFCLPYTKSLMCNNLVRKHRNYLKDQQINNSFLGVKFKNNHTKAGELGKGGKLVYFKKKTI